MSRSGTMSDRATVVLAMAAGIGAYLAFDVPILVAVGVLVAGLLCRRPWLLCVGACLLASSLGVRAWDGLDVAPTGRLEGVATLVADPEPIERGVRVDVRLGSHRYEARAFGASAGGLRDRSAGERVELGGIARRVPQTVADWLASRHVGAQLDVDDVGRWSAGDPASRLGNLVRRAFLRGAAVLPPDQASLFAGFVLGDDRQQRPVVADDFRAAGLTHLLAVSGQNVAFVLVVASPVLRRLGFRARFVTTVGLIGFFALVTRFEPSVVRAAAMAGLAVLASTLGREITGLRVLSLAVTGLLLVDPLLVHSIGFGLSVAASAGILLVAPPLRRVVPGPRWLADLTAVTTAAQLGVAPLLVPAFGGLPVAALPANLLAVPAAGPLMAWGMTGGLVAGLLAPMVGDGVTRVIHLPTTLLVEWIAGVARLAARLTLGELRPPHLAVAAVAGALLVGRRLADDSGVGPLDDPCAVGRVGGLARLARVGRLARIGRIGRLARLGRLAWHPAVTVLGVAALVGAVVAPVLAIRMQSPGHVRPSAGAELWTTAGGVGLLALDGRARAGPLLEGVRRAGVRAVGLVVIRSSTGPRPLLAAIAAVADRYRSPPVLRSADVEIPGARPAREGAVYRLGDLAVIVESTADGRIELRVMARAQPGES
ncbi:MAG: ComEC/Rec2 family competence protein [Acidimicrobiales bacterium]